MKAYLIKIWNGFYYGIGIGVGILLVAWISSIVNDSIKHASPEKLTEILKNVSIENGAMIRSKYVGAIKNKSDYDLTSFTINVRLYDLQKNVVGSCHEIFYPKLQVGGEMWFEIQCSIDYDKEWTSIETHLDSVGTLSPGISRYF